MRNRWNISSINVISHRTLFYLGQKIILAGTVSRWHGEGEEEEGRFAPRPAFEKSRGQRATFTRRCTPSPVRETEILSPEGNKGGEREKNARG